VGLEGHSGAWQVTDYGLFVMALGLLIAAVLWLSVATWWHRANLHRIRPLVDLQFIEWIGLGYIVPGLVAHQFDRQGIVPTLTMLAIAAPIVRPIIWLWVHA
jgi:hypothetical protein